MIERSNDETSPLLRAGAEPSAGLLAVQSQITELFVSVTEVIGVPRSIAEIYGVVFSAPRPVAFQEIVERLSLSKGSVSVGLKALRNLGAVRKAYVPGERRDYFEPETELRTLVAGLLRDRVTPHIEPGKMRLARVRREISAENRMTAEELEILRLRLAKLESWSQQGGALLALLTKVLG